MAALACAWLACAAARADDQLDAKVTYFVEPAARERLHVVHPQASAAVDFKDTLSVRVGWDADIVTGATPRTYQKADVISAATQFSDVRNAFHSGADLHLGKATIGAGYTYAFENDYRSHVIDATAKVDLLGKNTTFALSYSHNFDSVCDADNRGAQPLQRQSLDNSKGCFKSTPGIVTEALAIDAYQASWTQILTPRILFQLSAGLEVLDGFQSNPYRRVRLFDGAAEAQESEPSLRQRANVTLRLKWALPSVRSAIGAVGRFYWDTWGVKSGTAELEADHHFTERLLFRLRARFYQQTRALFYRDAGEQLSYESVGPVGQYFTGDRELSPFRNWLVGAKVSYTRSAGEKGRLARLFNDVDLSIKMDVLQYDKLTPDPPNAARLAGLIQLPCSSNNCPGLFSAILLQAGVTARF